MSDETKKTKKCQFCGEEILEVAVKCKHCKTDLQTENKKQDNTDSGETLGYMMIVVPIISSFLILFLYGTPSSVQVILIFTIIITAILGGCPRTAIFP